jgi:hypothetical protein
MERALWQIGFTSKSVEEEMICDIAMAQALVPVLEHVWKFFF